MAATNPELPDPRTLPFRAVLALPDQAETLDGPRTAPFGAVLPLPPAEDPPAPSGPTVPFGAVLPVPGERPADGGWSELALVEPLERSAGATRYRGEHPESGPCEVTLLSPEGAAAVGRTFLLEARLETLVPDTPSAAPVIALGASPRPWVARAWSSGPSLADRLEAGLLPLHEVAAAGLAAALALEAAHGVRLAHGDLLPADLRLAPDGPAVLTGFGRHTAVDPLGRRRPFGCGDPLPGEGVAPERSGGKPPSAASDVFALGHLLEAALAGRRSRGAAAAIAALVERCTASAPEARPAAADVAAELRPWACEPDGQLPEAVLGLLALIALLGGLLAAWWL